MKIVLIVNMGQELWIGQVLCLSCDRYRSVGEHIHLYFDALPRCTYLNDGSDQTGKTVERDKHLLIMLVQ